MLVTSQRWPPQATGNGEHRRLSLIPMCSLCSELQSRRQGLPGAGHVALLGRDPPAADTEAGAEKCLHLEQPPSASPPPWPWNSPSSAREHLRLIHLDPSVRKVHFRPSLTFPGGKLALTSQSVCDISIKRGVTKAEPLTFGAVHQW